MSQPQNHAMPHEQFLTVATNLLHRGLVEVGRTQAKQRYRQLEEGAVLPLSRVRLEDGSLADFLVSLDHSEFRGKLNYGAFRTSLTALLANLASSLEQQKEFRVFTDQGEGLSMIYGITAVTVEQGAANVMVLSAGPAAQAGATELRLMYLDPAQFAEGPDQGAA